MSKKAVKKAQQPNKTSFKNTRNSIPKQINQTGKMLVEK